MRIRIVDAFTDRPFAGNPAGVLLLDAFPEDAWLQNVALEVNHAETAFAHPLPEGGEADWALRWFTPVTEVAMCGHATLATAHVLATTDAARGPVRFATRSGVLTATTNDDGSITLDFPTARLTQVEVPAGVAEALGAEPLTTHGTGPSVGDLLIELTDEKTVRGLTPDHKALSRYSERGIIATTAPKTPHRAMTSSRAASSRTWASTRTRSPAAPTPRSPPTGPNASAAPTSPACRHPPAQASSAPNSATTAPCSRAARSPSSRANSTREQHGRGVRHPVRPFQIRSVHAVGSHPTLPASSAYPTNAPMSSREWATTSGPTRPQRRYR